MWVKKEADLTIPPPKKFSDWMHKPKNMGDTMRKVCSKLSLQILDQTFGLPFSDEEALLELDAKAEKICYLRRVLLLGNNIPFCFANVVIPKKVYLHYIDAFNSLGTKLIGETLLYNNPNTIRESFEYGQIDKTHPLYEIITSANENSLSSIYWGRRSVFKLNKTEPLLISEIFFNDIPSYPELL
jgi:chorismate-pyruvate lyase